MHRYASVVVATVLGFTVALAEAEGSTQSVSSEITTAAATQRTPSLTPVADWAPIFADWEASCSPSAEMRKLVDEAQREQRNLPNRYRSQVGSYTRPSAKTAGWARLTLAGTYQGMPIQALLWRDAPNTGATEYRLLMDVPLEAALRVAHIGGREMRAVQLDRTDGGQQVSLLCLKGG